MELGISFSPNQSNVNALEVCVEDQILTLVVL